MVLSKAVGFQYVPASLIEQQGQWLLLIAVSVLELLPRQEPCKWHHGVLHVHDAPLLLVNVRGINDQALQLVQRQ